MQKILDLLKGKKTYIVAFVGSLIALLQAFGIDIPADVIPSWAWHLLEFLGLATLRGALAKSKQEKQ